MNIYDATETAYKNGYKAGVKDFAERLKGKVEAEIYDDVDPSGETLRYEYYIVYVEDIDEALTELMEGGKESEGR